MPENQSFNSPDDLIRHVKSRADDIEAVWIVFDNAIQIRGIDGIKTVKLNVAGVITYCASPATMYHAVDLERLLNDEGIRRLRIPFRLLLPGQSLPQKPNDG
jgi:hypothetical protein